MEDWSAWIGKAMAERETMTLAPLARLAALLDRDAAIWQQGFAPPLAHWCYFLPGDRQSAIDIDGHPKRGAFLPPIPLPKRMWAGSRIRFEAPLTIGSEIERRSTIRAITPKQGASGPLVFVTVERQIGAGGSVAVVEEQDLVYRAAATTAQSPTRDTERPVQPAGPTRRIMPDPILLFRFSALTFNAHRIHYDRDYARAVEGYPGLVVHGPLQAMLLMHFFLEQQPEAVVTQFDFRGQRPLLDTAPFELCMTPGPNGTALFTRMLDGAPAMHAEVRTA